MFEKYRKSVPSNDIVVTFSKMYRYRYRRYFFGEVSVPITSLLLKYRVPSSGNGTQPAGWRGGWSLSARLVFNFRGGQIGHCHQQLAAAATSLCWSSAMPQRRAPELVSPHTLRGNITSKIRI